MVATGGSGSFDARIRADVAEFLSSPRAAKFTAADRAAVGEVARAFLDVCYGALGTRPDLLDEVQLREALADHLPAKLDPSAAASKRAPEIVHALLDHCFDTHPNPNAWKFDAIFESTAANFTQLLKERGGRDVAADPEPIRRPGAKLGRNDPCPCGSGRKYKKCCGAAAL